MMTEGKCPDLGSGNAGDVGNLHWSDVVVIVLYFIGVIAVGIWSSFKNRGSVEGDLEKYRYDKKTKLWIYQIKNRRTFQIYEIGCSRY